MNKNIEKAVKVLNEGGIIIFPTDTAIGIGCRIDNQKSIERLFRLRKRPENQPTPVLVSSFEMAREYILDIPQDIKSSLIDKFWPGALTIVLPAKVKKVPELVRGGEKNIGIRMPNNLTILEIIEKVGVPILGPSANFHGEQTPFTKEDLDRELLQNVDFVVEGECLLKDVSTVIDCSSKPWKILREGAVKIQNYNKSVVLLINTSNNKEIEVGLEIKGKRSTKKKALTEQKREVVINMIDEILRKNNIDIHDLTGVNVNNGPGSFTGLRVGIAIANALGSLLKIPVNGKKIGELENAVYN